MIGTGKPFLVAIIAYHLLKNAKIEILVLSSKGHALDDFIHHLTNIGIHLDDVTRLGSGCAQTQHDISINTQKRLEARARFLGIKFITRDSCLTPLGRRC